MKAIANIEEFQKVIDQDKPVLLDFYADWCGPCIALLPTVEKLADKYKDDFIVRKINVDKHPAIAQQYKVRSIPALFILKDKEIKEQLIGMQSEQKLETLIQAQLTRA